MAITLQYTCDEYTYPNAYIKANIGRATVEETAVLFYVWPTQQDRIDNKQPIYSNVRIFPTDFELAAENPIAYVYGLLKTSSEFENAQDILE